MALLQIEQNINIFLRQLLHKKTATNKNINEFMVINHLSKNWQQIVGLQYCKYCKPKSINIIDKEVKLTIIAYNSAVAFFLNNATNLIMERIAILYGYKAIKKITIKQELKDIT